MEASTCDRDGSRSGWNKKTAMDSSCQEGLCQQPLRLAGSLAAAVLAARAVGAPLAVGGVKANVQRWLGQFKEPVDKLKAKINDETIDGTKVTYVTAEGTFMKGPPFGGNKVPVPDSGLLGTIIGGKQGAVFIKTTGPTAIVQSAEKALKAMVAKALKKK